jgi:hypothetical protein
MYADDIVLISDDPSKLQLMVSAIHAAFQRWGLMISVGKTKGKRIHAPLPGEDRAPLPVIFVGDPRINNE